MADVPVEAGFDSVVPVKKSSRMRQVELKVMAGYSEPRTEPDRRRICDAGIGDIRNQIKDVVRGAGKDIAEVDSETMPGASRANGCKVVFRLVLSTVTRSDREFGNNPGTPCACVVAGNRIVSYCFSARPATLCICRVATPGCEEAPQ